MLNKMIKWIMTATMIAMVTLPMMLMGLNIINIDDDDGRHLKKNVGVDAACGWRNAAKRVSNLLKSNNLGLI